MASGKDTQEQAARGRIMTHMNNDHHDSVVRYLQHFGHLSSLTASSGRITDISLSHLTLTYSGSKTLRVPFEPPMNSFREARERVVALDKTCRKALGHSDITVRSWAPPLGKYFAPFLGCILVFIAYSQRWWFAPGGPVARNLGQGFAAFSWRIQPWLFFGLLAIHGLETVYFMNAKMGKHGINPRQWIWWAWTVSVLIEGIGAQRRFAEHVANLAENERH